MHPNISHRIKATIVSDTTTLRRHLDAVHRAAYHKWALKNNFESRLPSDIQARKKAEEQQKAQQGTLDGHLKDMSTKERNIKYSEDVFRRAVVEWLICTDQPISAVEHPKFKQMIHVAAAATNGVTIPSRKAARAGIMRMFNSELEGLRKKLTVRPSLFMTVSFAYLMNFN
ncbi:hypothetical protein C8Q76DRAFT_633194 [Earliella scabrosa]|nr:hypothetical protein C8Q76DRAFT_633194 [Earliella scabrosa]